MEIFGSVHVWISTEQVASDLMAKRGSVYSDRPKIPNLPDNRTSGDYLPLLGRNGQYRRKFYSIAKSKFNKGQYANVILDTWKRQRKFAHHIFTRANTESQYAYPTLERKRLLHELLKNPADYVFLMEAYTGRTISRLSWGSAAPAPQLKIDAFGLLSAISPSGAVPNVVAWLEHLPAWLR